MKNVVKKPSDPVPSIDGLTVREFWAQLPPGHSLTLTKMAKESKVPLTSLSTHLRHSGVDLSVKNAKKLEKWSGGKISAAKTVGL